MPQNEIIPTKWVFLSSTEDLSRIELQSTSPHCPTCLFSVHILSPSLLRISFTSPTHLLPPYPSCTPPKSLEPFNITLTGETATQRIFTTDKAQITLSWANTPQITVHHFTTGQLVTTPIYADLPLRSYTLDGPGTAHYTVYNKGALHAGLGEKAAPFDLSGRTFRLTAIDSFGYDGHRTDPLYKHIPLLLTATPDGAAAQFSASLVRGMVSIGGEMDGHWGKYKVLRQDYGGVDEYVIVGKDLQEVVRQYAGLIGKPLRVPRWALGYIAGGYKYSALDEPRASEALSAFAKKMKQEEIPCSAFQLSSGYMFSSVEPRVRNVFTWSKERFPDPKAFLNEFKAAGIRVVANVKPYVLKQHPCYEDLRNNGAFFWNPRTKEGAVARLWSAGGGESGEGGHLDFSSKAAFDWWYKGVKQLLEDGVTGVWNDNNEYTIPEDGWECKLDYLAWQEDSSLVSKNANQPQNRSVGIWGRAMHTELMAKSSYLAAKDAMPGVRPYVLTRSATAGTMRYAASSWSGDNVTSWASMRANNAMSLNAGLSLLTVGSLSY
jgi:alpha-glucosidase (family GH31 glycosyl hydrolase)